VGPDAPGGAPGQYQVTQLFVRPNRALPTHEINLDPDAAEGDSLIRLLPPPGAVGLIEWKVAVNVDGRNVEFKFKENKGGFLARVDSEPFEASSFDDAESISYRGLASVLTHGSTQLDTPVHVGRVYIRELATYARRVSVGIPFPEVRFPPAGRGQVSADFRMYSSLYREGLSSNRPACQVLCFHKILEGIAARRKTDRRCEGCGRAEADSGPGAAARAVRGRSRIPESATTRGWLVAGRSPMVPQSADTDSASPMWKCLPEPLPSAVRCDHSRSDEIAGPGVGRLAWSGSTG
jgi:hypothetical protein